MKATIWGCRGSLATPGPATVRYGGNTSCVHVRTASGRTVVLDAGTGRTLAGQGDRRRRRRAARPVPHAPASRPRRGARLLRAALRPRRDGDDPRPAARRAVAREVDLDLPLTAVLSRPVRARAGAHRVHRGLARPLRRRRPRDHRRPGQPSGTDGRLPPRGGRTHARVRARTTSRASTRTRRSSWRRARTSSSTTRSTRRRSTRRASAGATHRCPTSRASCAPRARGRS